MSRLIVWFSCGAASAVALKILAHHKNVVPVYCDVSRDEHPDNLRFLVDIEAWAGVKVQKIASKRYATIQEVFEQTRYMSGIKGARCTTEMKKIPRMEFARADDVHVFGFTADEGKRRDAFEQRNPDLLLAWPLIEQGYTKADCLQMIRDAGIELPVLYSQGFRNNNCIGCVKATSIRYWERVRRLYPEVFEQRAKTSRELGVRLVRASIGVADEIGVDPGARIFLDQIPAGADDGIDENISCGPECGQMMLKI